MSTILDSSVTRLDAEQEKWYAAVRPVAERLRRWE